MKREYRDMAKELKRNSAAMGMVFFGLKYGKPVSDLDEYMDTGISVCEVIIKGPALSKSNVPTYEDRFVKEAFMRVARRQEARSGELSGEDIAREAEEVKRTLEQLRDQETVSDEALNASAEFFRKIYLAT
ncbi:MAG TPA: hypothetical protein VD861_12675 [Pyrinomonadaceae bacterium]|nr:hypothetical protein [Pyrinomonadaceae bacterium]